MSGPRVRVVLRYAGIRQVAKSQEVEKDMLRRADKVRQAAQSLAPPDQELFATPWIGRNRARASVMAPGGLAAEHRDRFLGKSIDAARG